MGGATAVWLADGKRLHFQHGPIDLIIEASGTPDSVDLAYRAAWERFENVLAELVEELPRLRDCCPLEGLCLRGAVARRMELACRPHAAYAVTPMAAVAGAVADEILDVMTGSAGLDRAYVNNGGDIALHLNDGERFEVAMAGLAPTPVGLGKISLGADDPGGLATSGRHGRSFSLGIADSVTVLADNAAVADVAATLIANAVDLPEHPGIRRHPARDLDPESDLGDRLVTVDVPELPSAEIRAALAAGAARAKACLDGGTIAAAALYLGDQAQIIGIWPKPGAITDISRKMLTNPPRQATDGPL